MNKRPIIALVGRPNVGKSALFNRIAGKRLAIVDETEGVTRDRILIEVDRFDCPFALIDTGGMDPRSKDHFKKHILMQAEAAISEADSLVMVVDATTGPTSMDKELATFLLKTGKPLTLAINKIDDPFHENLIHNFYELGISKMVPISATHDFNIEELTQTALAKLPKGRKEIDKPSTKIAIVGRPNVGKSTLINGLLGMERVIVSPIAGTTRDAIDIPFTYEGKDYTLIDTAGLKRKKAEKNVIEKFATIRTQIAIERSDVVFLLLDAVEGLTEQEKRIAKIIEEAGKGCVILINKWDLVKGFRMEHCLKALRQTSPFLENVPIHFISAAEKRNLDKIFPEAQAVLEASKKRLTTPELNKFLEKAMQLNHPTMLKGRRLRIYYMTQVDTSPPRFILFVNTPALMEESYKKYLMNQLREQFGFTGVPLIFHLKGKSDSRAHHLSQCE